MERQHLNQTKNTIASSNRENALAQLTEGIARSSTHPIEELQGAIGNRAVNQLLVNQPVVQAKPMFRGLSRELAIQPKLTIGAVGDKYEQEADRLASQVVEQINAPSAAQPTQGQSLQRQEDPVEELQAKPSISVLQRSPLATQVQLEAMPEEELQAKPILQRQEAIAGGEASTDLDTAINSARGSGQPLDVGMQQSMGQAMGADFSGVKVHTDTQSDRLNRSIQAKAFTTGQDVFFRQGAYQPGSRGGQELIAHELTHVVQQGGAIVQCQPKNQDSNQLRETASPTIAQIHSIQPRIQRFSINDNPVDWSEALTAKPSNTGATGVIFVQDIARNELVVKGTNDPPSLVLFAETLHKDIAGVETPKSRVVTGLEREKLKSKLGQLADKAYDTNEDYGAELQQKVQSFFAQNNTIYLMEKAKGKPFGEMLKDTTAKAIEMLKNPEHMKKLGKLHAIDMFLGNGDRLAASNLGNWMTTDDGAITAIDNIDPYNRETSKLDHLNQPRNYQEEHEPPNNRLMLQISRDSNIKKFANENLVKLKKEMKKEKYNGDSSIIDREMNDVVVKEMASNFAQGIKEGRDLLIKKFQPTFGQRSRTYKEKVHNYQKEYGSIEWQHIKDRAKYMKSLK